jgi:hypothetical protein
MSSILQRCKNVAVACHDFIADPNDPEDPLRTRDYVYDRLVAAGFQAWRRLEHPTPWIRDTVYATRTEPAAAGR